MKMRTFQIWMTIFCLIIPASAFAGENDQPLPDYLQAEKIAKRPVAEIPQQVFEFSPVVDGTRFDHTFIVKNTGSLPLEIRDIITGCACTTAAYPKEIPAGEEGEITFTMDTKGYGGQNFSRKILVSSNDPDKGVFYLYIEGDVEKFAEMDPRALRIKTAPGSGETFDIAITPRPQYPFKINGSSVDDILADKLSVVDIRQVEGKYIVTAKSTAQAPVKYMGKIHLQTDSPIRPDLTINVRGTVE